MKTKYSSRTSRVSEFRAQRNDIIELATAHTPFDIENSSSQRVLMDAVDQVLPEHREGEEAIFALSPQTITERVEAASTDVLYMVLKSVLYKKPSLDNENNIHAFEEILINELMRRR